MRQTPRTILIATLLLVVLGCHRIPPPQEQILRITDVTRGEVFDLTPTNREMITISHVSLHFEGQLDGTAFMVPFYAPTQELSGAVNITWGGDVSSATNYLLQYTPG